MTKKDKIKRRLIRAEKKRKKQIPEPKSWVFGFDETNNGFHIKPKNPYFKTSLVVTGYATEDLGRANYGSEPYERKGHNYTKRNLPKTLEKCREYLSKHPTFLYTTISKENAKIYPLSRLKADAIALLTLSLFLKYPTIDPQRTKIIMDEMGGRKSSEEVDQGLEQWLKKTELQIPHKIKREADEKTIAVRKADRIGHYITAIHHFGTNNKWPYRNKRISFDSLGETIIRFLERDEIDYPEP
ncbi:hypothetical protein HOE04_02420 [archaeon]|jgi:hypothetical protein|nr:hypothetical protein [archaeon]